MLDDSQVTALIQRFYAYELDGENRIRLNGVEFDEANRQAIIAHYDQLGDRVRQALARNELERADEWVEALLEREGITVEIDKVTRAKLQQGILRAGCDIAVALRKRYEGEFHYTPTDPILLDPHTNVTAAGRGEPARVPIIEAASAAQTPFSERAEEFRLKRMRLKTWDGQTALQARKTYKLFAEVCDDRPIAGYMCLGATKDGHPRHPLYVPAAQEFVLFS